MKLKISKIEAALRQLETACELYLREADEIAIHTLAFAAQAVLEDIGKKKKIDSLKRSTLAMVKEEHEAEFGKSLNAAAVFFKHANRDADGVLEFDQAITEFYLFDAVILAHTLSGKWSQWQQLYYWWFIINNPTSVDYAKSVELKKIIEDLLALKIADKRQYLEVCLGDLA